MYIMWLWYSHYFIFNSFVLDEIATWTFTAVVGLVLIILCVFCLVKKCWNMRHRDYERIPDPPQNGSMDMPRPVEQQEEESM